jgi:hypothetical protein
VVILHHVGGLQVLVIDRVLLTQKGERGLVVEILPLTPHVLMCLGQERHRLAPAVTAALAARDTPLRSL